MDRLRLSRRTATHYSLLVKEIKQTGSIPILKKYEDKGIGRDSIAGFLAEIGDIERYRHPKQIIKLAGLNLKENTSGKHKGQMGCTYIKYFDQTKYC
jgi:transposase